MSRKTSSSAPCVVVELRRLHRVAGIPQVEEAGPLDDPSVLDVQAWNDSFGKHRRSRSSMKTANRHSGLDPGSSPGQAPESSYLRKPLDSCCRRSDGCPNPIAAGRNCAGCADPTFGSFRGGTVWRTDYHATAPRQTRPRNPWKRPPPRARPGWCSRSARSRYRHVLGQTVQERAGAMQV